MIDPGTTSRAHELSRPSGRAGLADFRELMNTFPTGVAVVTSIDEDGDPRGMTCSSLTSVTLRPPTLLACLRTGSATLDAVRGHGAFAVNLLHARGHRTAELFAGPVGDRFGNVRWCPSWSGLPWLVGDAFAMAECVVSGSLEVGDHTVVLGEVGIVVLAEDTPLLYGMRRFTAWCGSDTCVQRGPPGR